MGELGAAAVLLLGFGVVFLVLFRSPTTGQLTRRRLLVDGRHRDADPLRNVVGGPLLLIVLALVDLSDATAEGSPLTLVTAFGLGIVLAIVVRVDAMSGIVVFLVGAAALAVSVWQLLVGDGYSRILDGTARIVVVLATAGFLLLVAALRLVFAPLRATGAEARGAFLAVYGVLQAMVGSGILWLAGGLSELSWSEVAMILALAAVVALGVAVMPTFTTSCIGIGLTVLAFITGRVGTAADTTPLLGAIAGAVAAYWVTGALRRH